MVFVIIPYAYFFYESDVDDDPAQRGGCCSSQAGAAEVLTEACGIVQEDPRDAEELERALLAICGDRARREQMAAAAPEVAAQYSWDRHFTSMLELYEEVAREKAVAAGR